VARLRDARVLLLLTALVGALLALLITEWRGPAFEATSQIQVSPALALDVVPFDTPDPQAMVAVEYEFLQSDAVADAAQELLPDATDEVSFAVVPDSTILAVSARADDRATARITAETYVAAYADLLHARRLVELDQAEQAVNDQLEDTRSLAAEAGPDDLRALEETERELTTALTDIDLARDLGAAGSAGTVGDTTVTDQSGLSVLAAVVLGALLGLAGGAIIALLAQRLAPTFVTAEDVRRDDLPAPLLAVMPPAEDETDLQGTDADPYRALRSELTAHVPTGGAVLFMTPDGGSAAAHVVAGLATACAGFGEGVVAAELDLREPVLHLRLDAAPTPGLTTVLNGEAALLEAAQRLDVDGQVWFLAAGEPPEHPAEVLASSETHQMLTQVTDGADRVLLHGPPITIATDAAEIRSLVTAAVLVIEAGTSRRQATHDAAQRIIRLGMPLVGLVLVGATGKEILRPPDRPRPEVLQLGTAADAPGSEQPARSPHSVEAERLMMIDLTPVHPPPPGPSPPLDPPVIALPERSEDQENDDDDENDDDEHRIGPGDDSAGARDQGTPVHHQGVSGDPAGEVRREEERGAGDVRGFSKPA
jgi:Mrp family chromosome partitioning ATPase